MALYETITDTTGTGIDDAVEGKLSTTITDSNIP